MMVPLYLTITINHHPQSDIFTAYIKTETRCSGHCAAKIQDFLFNCLPQDQTAFVKTVSKIIAQNLDFRLKLIKNVLCYKLVRF